MLKYLISRNLLLNFISLFSFLIFIFFLSHIIFGERSVWKIFKLNNEIINSKEKLKKINLDKQKIISEINLLRDDNLDPDLISEISQKLIGLVYSDQIVIKVPK